MSTAPTFTNEFYITLPSNSSAAYFPDNRPNRFRTKLAKAISLRGNWEVGLAEIQYPHTWNTINRAVVLQYTLGNQDQNGQEIWWTLKLPAGHYTNISAVLKTIHYFLPPEAKAQIQFLWDEHARRVSIYCVNQCKVRFPDKLLLQVLGFDPTEQYQLHGQRELHVAKRPPDLKLGMFGLFVYSDIVDPVPVGDVVVPLLRIVAVEGEDGDYVSKTYDRVHYVGVAQSHFDSVEIHINTDLGDFVHFEHGKVVVKLHFRPRRLQYL